MVYLGLSRNTWVQGGRKGSVQLIRPFAETVLMQLRYPGRRACRPDLEANRCGRMSDGVEVAEADRRVICAARRMTRAASFRGGRAGAVAPEGTVPKDECRNAWDSHFFEKLDPPRKARGYRAAPVRRRGCVAYLPWRHLS